MSFSTLTLPSFEFNNLLLFGLLVVAGLIGANVASRTGKIPGITGILLMGLVLGPSGLGLLTPSLLSNARVFVDVSLGLILFQLGLLLDLRELKANRAVMTMAVLESLLTYIAIFLALRLLDIPLLQCAMAAAVGVSSSPAVLLMVCREFNARGPVTNLALKLVAVNNVMAFLLFSAALPFLHVSQAHASWITLTQPLVQLAGSAALAWVMAWIMIWLAHRLVKPGQDSFSLVAGFVLLTLGVASLLHLSSLLTLLALGLFVRNLETHDGLKQVEFGRGGELFFLILFVVAGANLHLHDLYTSGFAALAFVLSRYVGKQLALSIGIRSLGLGQKHAVATGMTLLPMAGLAIGLTQSTQELYPEFGGQLAAVVLAAVAILETIGPIATEIGLKRAGEVHSSAKVEH